MNIHTYADLDAVPPKRMWQLMRTLRHEPPGRAAKGHRRETFNAALEQAEQLFAAAEATGAASRPILVFYGITQLGRAIAAVSTQLDNQEYRLSGHGISDGALEGAAKHGLATLSVRSRENGAFPTVARTLKADPISAERSLGEIWALIPDSARFPLPGVTGLERLYIQAESPHIMRTQDSGRFVISNLPLALLQRPDEDIVTGPGPRLAALMMESQEDADRIAYQRQRLQEWLAQYPTLAGWDFKHYVEPDEPVDYQLHDNGTRLSAQIRLPRAEGQSENAVIQSRAVTYHSVASIYPTLDKNGQAAHPFMLWWAVLFTLSRLARYEPRDWVQMIDVAHSADAAAIEYLLSESMLALPEIAYACLVKAQS